ncbi:hypothetical protein [Hyphomicrobium sp. DMF-1]|uniref:hypothetical protein n=1 Tax=Hyphomicrobium sp. DMF-1 TaxID=3019544 RepID=UPI0022EC00C5|nr:hypothetical protein [Hyphomicrobium sp. DMF-1]WBT38042.1 hypothetical protein PE058_20670 [Hyphomicrobium sp. DMF-1]
MTVSAITFPFTALVLPLLTSGAAWAIAVWALKQNSPRIEFLQRWKPPTRASGHKPVAALPRTHTTDKEKEGDCLP